MLDVDINYDVEKEEYMDEEKIIEIVTYIISNEKKEEFLKKDYYVSILVTNNEVIREINKEYRDKDMPTDVLSFAYNETENFGPVEVIGDIVISIDRVKEQAIEYNHSVDREFFYVLVHGILHILGYDHIVDEDKKTMREKEEIYLKKFNFER